MEQPAGCAPQSVDLEAVIATAELGRRAPRPPDHEAENRILVSLAQDMARSPSAILHSLAQAALTACRAGSAGISLIEEDGGIFRWQALVGELAPHLGGTTPRSFSPCGTVVERNSIHLFSRPERHFGYFADRFFFWLDWLPSRLTAASFAIVGNFEDAVYCWRTQALSWAMHTHGIILATGAGAIGVRLGDTLHQYGTLQFRPEMGTGDEADVDYMQSAVGLIWRALVLWVFLLLLVSVAYSLG